MGHYSVVVILIAISVLTADDTPAMATLDVPQAVTHSKDEEEEAKKWTGGDATLIDEDRAFFWPWQKSRKELSAKQLKAIDAVYDQVFPDNKIANVFAGKNLATIRKGVRKVVNDDSERYLAELLMRKKGAGKLSNEVNGASDKHGYVGIVEIITKGQLRSWKHHNTPLKDVVAALFPIQNFKDKSGMNAEFTTAWRLCRKYAIARFARDEDVMTDVAAAMEAHLGAKELSTILEDVNFNRPLAREFKTALFKNWMREAVSVQSAFKSLELDKGQGNIFSRPQMVTFLHYAAVVTEGDATKEFDFIITLVYHYKSIGALRHAMQSAPVTTAWNLQEMMPKVESTLLKYEAQLGVSPPANPHAASMPQGKVKPAAPSLFKANEPYVSSGKRKPPPSLYDDRPHAKPASSSPFQRARVSNSPIARFRRWLSKIWAKIRALWHSE